MNKLLISSVVGLIAISLSSWAWTQEADNVSVESEASVALATAEATQTDSANLDQDIQSIKDQVIDLNRDLFILEEELLFPANTQVSVFLSVDVGAFFELDSAEIRLNNKVVSQYLYTEREQAALLRGGVHRLYLGNLKSGEHELIAYFTGKGPNNRDYRRGANLDFTKSLGAKFIELKISDNKGAQQPEFTITEWE